jgi:hypothetical protein
MRTGPRTSHDGALIETAVPTDIEAVVNASSSCAR